MREPCLDYFYGDEVRVNSFCRLPRIFVTDEFYRTIPIEIKLLYGVMLDRVAMSMRNNWRENGRVFIYFTIKEAMRTLHVGKHKAVSLFARMETLGLIRRRKQERGKPDRIFVREFLEVKNAEEAFPEEAADCSTTEAASVDLPPEAADIDETPVTVTEMNGTPVTVTEVTETNQMPVQVTPADSDSDSETPDAVRRNLFDLLRECAVGVRHLGDLLLGGGASEPQTSQNQTSRLPLSGSLHFPKPHPNYTDIKYKELLDYNQSIYPEGAALYEEDDDSDQAKAARKEEHLELLRELIRDNIDYDGLMRDYPNRRREIANYVEIMAQACCSDRREIRINQQDFPQVCVRSAFEKLERKHMVYVLKCMAHITPKVRNIRAYALSTLYNSYLIFQCDPLSEKSREKARKHYKNWHEAYE